jgi:hypothetical protein
MPLVSQHFVCPVLGRLTVPAKAIVVRKISKKDKTQIFFMAIPLMNLLFSIAGLRGENTPFQEGLQGDSKSRRGITPETMLPLIRFFSTGFLPKHLKTSWKMIEMIGRVGG